MNVVLKDNSKKEKEYNEALNYFDATKKSTYKEIHNTYKHKAMKCHPDVFPHHVKECDGNKACLQKLREVCNEGAREMYTINGNMDVIRRHDDRVVELCTSQTNEEGLSLEGLSLSGAQIDEANFSSGDLMQ